MDDLFKLDMRERMDLLKTDLDSHNRSVTKALAEVQGNRFPKWFLPALSVLSPIAAVLLGHAWH
jgi:hypothetical protein